MQSEADVKKAVKEAIRRFNERHDGGIWYFMPVQAGIGQSAIPDFILCVYGYFCAIETKFGGYTQDARQKYIARAIRIANGHVFIIDETNVESLDQIFESYYHDYCTVLTVYARGEETN